MASINKEGHFIIFSLFHIRIQKVKLRRMAYIKNVKDITMFHGRCMEPSNKQRQ